LKGGEMSRRITVSLLATALLAALFLCSFSAGPALAGAEDNSIVAAFESARDTLDWYGSSDREVIMIYNELSDPLIGRNPETMKLDPAWSLAESWKYLDDNTIEIKLRPGVKFHTGNPLTSEDFRWIIMDRVVPEEMKSPQRTNLSWVKDVKILDDLTFQIISAAPYAPGLMRLNTVFAVDSKYIKEKGLPYFAEHPVGTGPYAFSSWEKGSKLEFVKNPNYWRKEYPKTDKLIIRIIPESSTNLASLLKGSLDWMWHVSPDQTKIIEDNPKTKVASSPILRIVFYFFDVDGRAAQSPVMDKRVRQAIWHAIDFKSIHKNILLGYAVPIYTPLNPWHFGFDAKIKEQYPYDPEKAKKLLAEANYPTDYEMPLMVSGDMEMNLAVQGYLSKVGIKIKITDWRANGPEQERLWRAGRLHDMMYWNWGSYNVFDADALLYTWLHSSSAGCYAHTPEMDKLQDDARATMDPVKRQAMYEKLQEWVVDNAIMIPSHARYGIYGVNKKLQWKAVGDEVPRWYSASWEK